MKRPLIELFAALAITVTAAPLALLVPIAPVQAQQGQTKVFLDIEGMTCGSCQITARKALEDLDGVSEAKVSLKKKMAKVTYDPAKISTKRMVKAIVGAGFRAKVHKSS